jgi:hypothetical protein
MLVRRIPSETCDMIMMMMMIVSTIEHCFSFVDSCHDRSIHPIAFVVVAILWQGDNEDDDDDDRDETERGTCVFTSRRSC